ncbi:MAG: ATPase domain-containing protein [Desulfosoma sp.]
METILVLHPFLVEQGATVLFSSQSSPETPDEDLQFLCDGIIRLHLSKDLRTIQVTKFRGSRFRHGSHEFEITPRGVVVYPKVRTGEMSVERSAEMLSCRIPELDQLLGEGLQRCTTTSIVGPTGVGKSTLAMAFAKEAAGRGERTVMYAFDEEPHKILLQCDRVNIPARAMSSRMRETVKMLRSTLPFTIEVREHYADFVPTVMADPTQMQQMIMNLCTNAFHAMKDHGGTLNLRLKTCGWTNTVKKRLWGWNQEIM